MSSLFEIYGNLYITKFNIHKKFIFPFFSFADLEDDQNINASEKNDKAQQYGNVDKAEKLNASLNTEQAAYNTTDISDDDVGIQNDDDFSVRVA